MTDLWTYRTELKTSDVDVVGFDVVAKDGDIGKVDESSDEFEDAYLVVDTGFWIFGKKRIIPARLVTQIDQDEQQIHISMTKDEVKGAPDYNENWGDPQERAVVGAYFVPFIY